MSLTPLTQTPSASQAPTTATATGSSSLGETDFLKLLTAQLANQDPSSPMDNSQFVAQLAQFSSVEQLTSVNSNLQHMLVGQASTNQTSDAVLVGKSVLYRTSTLALSAGTTPPLLANFGGAACKGAATITDSSGKVVRTLDLGSQPAGQVVIPWDGRDDRGNPLPAGSYTVAITAADTTGQAVKVTEEARSLVTGISFANGYPQPVVAGGPIDMSSISEIDQAA